MESKQKFSGVFATPCGIAVIFALMLIAAYFNYFQLSVFLFFTGLLFTSSRMWGKKALKNIDIEIDGGGISVFPGADIPVVFKVRNGKALPMIWLEVYLVITDENCVIPDDTFTYGMYIGNDNSRFMAYGRKFTWVLWNQELVWKTNFTAKRRGIYKAENAVVSSGDGFGFYVRQESYSFKKPSAFVVYPEIFSVDVSVFLRNRFDSSEGGRGIYEDKTLLKSIREYSYTDSAKKINWRLAARQDELQVNIYESIRPRSVFFILDLGSFSKIIVKKETEERFYACFDEELEKALSLMASLVLKLEDGEMICGAAIPETQTHDGSFIMPQKESESILFALAGVEYSGGKAELDERRIFSNKENLGQVYIITRTLEYFSLKGFMDTLNYEATIISIEKSGEKTAYNTVFAEDITGRAVK